MSQSDVAKAVVLDAQITRLTEQLRELQFQATSASGSAVEEVIAARIENAEEQLEALKGMRDALMAGAST